MGVQGLWELLAPVGRRVSVEALSGKRLAIDSSIWIIQFMKAMRDEKGEMIRNAHLLGFFRRICKLLYLRVKPVFVFDGGTPALKRRTVIARRRQRERAQSRIRKTAEKLLLNHLRSRKLEEIAQNIGLQQQNKLEESETSSKKKADETNGADCEDGNTGVQQQVQLSDNLVNHDNTMCASLASEVERSNEDSDEPEQSVHAESEGSEDDDENEEFFVIPPTQGRIDPAVLASLPPSMQLELLVQMREQLVADNRKKFQKVAKNPASFSQMQIEAYLKTVAFRRDIDEVQKAATGKGIGGLPSARIASEANREYIFSTTFQPENLRNIESVANGSESIQGDGINTSQSQLELPTRNQIGTGSNTEENNANSESNQENNTAATNFQLQIKLCPEVGEKSNSFQLQEICSGKDLDDSSVGNEIEWEDEEGIPPIESRPIKGVAIELDKDELLSGEVGNEIEWEDEEETPVIESQPIKAVTIELDTNELLLAGVDLQKFYSEDNGAHSEAEEIEWEEDVPSAKAEKFQNISVSAEDNEIQWEDGSKSRTSEGPVALITSNKADSNTVMEIEAAELEEAIRRSLEDYGQCRASKLVIRESSHKDLNECATTPTCVILSTGSDSEETYFARERERKGKAVVQEDKKNCSLLNQFHVSSAGSVDDLKSSDNKTMMQTRSKSPPPEESFLTNMNGKSKSSGLDEVLPSRLESVSNSDVSIPLTLVAGKENPNQQQTVSTQENVEVKMSGIHNPENMSNPIEHEDNNIQPKSSAQEEDGPLDLIAGEANTNEQQTEKCTMSGIHNPESISNSVEHRNNKIRDFEAPVVHSNNASNTARVVVQNTCDVDFEEALLKDAEELDHDKEREAYEKREREIMAEREILARQQAELQAEWDSEQATLKETLEQEREFLVQEEMELRASQQKNQRNAESVTGEMFSECQELLQMFGLPYIIAPMEAEAQCAFMDSIGLVDGVVTEDCDVFLFGGRNVFKNIFDDRKYVETYYMKDIESELGLDQEKLIHMALLLGSDYTEGISGIGIVNAIEVVNAFQGESGLKKFKEWLDAPDLTLLDKVQGSGPKKQTKKKRNTVENEGEAAEKDESTEYNHRQQEFMDKHRAVSKNWNVPESFPNPVVINAYISPQVDSSTESFTWGRPDLEALRRLCFERFGWNKAKSDELLLPVLKEYDRHETQLRLEAFYSFNQRFAKIRSKRIQKAVSRIRGQISSDLVMGFTESDTEEQPPKKFKNTSNVSSEATEHKSSCTEVSPDVGCKQKGAIKHREATSGASGRGKKGGRGRGRGRASTGRRGRGRGKGIGKSNLVDPEDASMTDDSSSKGLSNLHDAEGKGCSPPAELRRSTRLTDKTVYTFSDSDQEDEIVKSKVVKSSTRGSSLTRSSDKSEELGRSAISEAHVKASESVKDDVNNMVKALLDMDASNLDLGDFQVTGCNIVSTNDAKSSDYITAGGGFCAMDGEDNSDYLVAGGGFCTSDGEKGSDPIKPDLAESHSKSGEGWRPENDDDTTADGRLKDASVVTSGQSLFRAVPFLRRKKHKAS